MSEYRHAREIIARLALELNLIVAREYFPTRPPEEITGLLLVERVLIADKRHGLSLAAVARRAQMPRNTVARRLSALIDAGLAKRDGRLYCADFVALDRAYRLRRLQKTLVRLKETAAELEVELSKLDK